MRDREREGTQLIERGRNDREKLQELRGKRKTYHAEAVTKGNRPGGGETGPRVGQAEREKNRRKK